MTEIIPSPVLNPLETVGKESLPSGGEAYLAIVSDFSE